VRKIDMIDKDMIDYEKSRKLLDDLVEEVLGEPFVDIISEIPVIGTGIKFIRAGFEINNLLFMKKLTKFVKNLKDISPEEVKKWSRKLEDEKEFRKKIGENLLLLINRIDDMGEKPEMVGKIFRAYIREQIDYSTFNILCRAVDRINLNNIQALEEFYSTKPERIIPEDDIMYDLTYAGLVTPIAVKGMHVGPLEGFYRNRYGEIFIELILNN
jgi:hypothetical protein